MALTVNERQVTWSAANSVSVSSGSSATSDVVSFTANTVFQARISLKAKNDGTPASGDTVDFYYLGSQGDPDGTGADEYATRSQGQHLVTLNTYADDPAIAEIWLPGPFYKAKIYAVNNSSGRAITVSATIQEHNG